MKEKFRFSNYFTAFRIDIRKFCGPWSHMLMSATSGSSHKKCTQWAINWVETTVAVKQTHSSWVPNFPKSHYGHCFCKPKRRFKQIKLSKGCEIRVYDKKGLRNSDFLSAQLAKSFQRLGNQNNKMCRIKYKPEISLLRAPLWLFQAGDCNWVDYS